MQPTCYTASAQCEVETARPSIVLERTATAVPIWTENEREGVSLVILPARGGESRVLVGTLALRPTPGWLGTRCVLGSAQSTSNCLNRPATQQQDADDETACAEQQHPRAVERSQREGGWRHKEGG